MRKQRKKAKSVVRRRNVRLSARQRKRNESGWKRKQSGLKRRERQERRLNVSRLNERLQLNSSLHRLEAPTLN